MSNRIVRSAAGSGAARCIWLTHTRARRESRETSPLVRTRMAGALGWAAARRSFVRRTPSRDPHTHLAMLRLTRLAAVARAVHTAPHVHRWAIGCAAATFTTTSAPPPPAAAVAVGHGTAADNIHSRKNKSTRTPKERAPYSSDVDEQLLTTVREMQTPSHAAYVLRRVQDARLAATNIDEATSKMLEEAAVLVRPVMPAAHTASGKGMQERRGSELTVGGPAFAFPRCAARCPLSGDGDSV